MMPSLEIVFLKAFFLIFNDEIIKYQGMSDKPPYLSRHISRRVQKLFDAFSCIVVTGARQVGKSTLLSHLFPKIPCVVFDPVHDIQNARSDPELFLRSNPPPLILDEIQYAPELVPVLKRRIDKNNCSWQKTS